MAELPPSRPENRHTTSLGIIARSRLLNALGTIANLATRATLPSPAEIEQVDGMLHAARVSIPLPLKFREIGASIADSPQVIMARLFLSMLLNKGYNMIHRRFLFVDSPSQTEDLYAHSRRRCLDASLEMLTLLRDLEQEMRPSGVLESMRWRVMSLLNHQFLTATMILCAVLYHPEVTYRREGIVRALRSTRDLWMRSNSLALSKDAQKAADIVGTALAHNDRPAPPAPAPAVSPPAVPSGPAAPAPHDTNMGMSIPTPAAPESAFLNQPPAVIAGGAAATYDDYGQPLDPNTAAAFQGIRSLSPKPQQCMDADTLQRIPLSRTPWPRTTVGCTSSLSGTDTKIRHTLSRSNLSSPSISTRIKFSSNSNGHFHSHSRDKATTPT